MFMNKDLSKTFNVFQALENYERKYNPNNCHYKAEKNNQDRQVHLSLQVKVISEALHNGMPRFIITADAKEIIGNDLAGKSFAKVPPHL